jgi:RNase P/RNase MRP subunit p29
VRVRNLILLSFALVTLTVVANAQDRSTGGIKGKVKVETGTPAGVAVVVRSGDREITRVATDKGGSFNVRNLRPGVYGLTFRKPGLSVGTIENVEVKGGKTPSLGYRLVFTIVEGSIAFIRGSVFSPSGRSVPGAKVELARILDDGTTKKIDGRITTETGSFVFRLTPELAKYRISVKIDGAEPASSDVEVDGAAVYRIAISLVASPKSDE